MEESYIERDQESLSIKHRTKFIKIAKASTIEDIEHSYEAEKQKFNKQISNGVQLESTLVLKYQLALSCSLFILFFAFYIKSLEGCPTKPVKIGECLRWLKENGPFLAAFGVASAFCYTTLIVLIICKIVNKYWLIPSLISMGIAYCIQGGVGFDDHGFFNRSIVLFAVAAMILVFFVIRGIYYICRRGKKHILFVLVCTTTFLIVFYFKYAHNSCNNWTKGISGKELLDIPGECTMHIPKYCELSIREGWFDINKYTQVCEKYKMKVEISWLPERPRNNQNLRTIGYPRMESHPNECRADEDKYKEYVISRIIDMDDPDIPQKVKEDIEITVDLTNDEFHKVNIDLKRNNTRVEEVKKIREKVLNTDKEIGKQRIDKDMLIIYMDNISRAHFYRKFKNLTYWLEENTNTENSEYNSYEYFRYHSKVTFTHPNCAAMYCGVDDAKYNDTNNIFKYFSENGYITGYFADCCQPETMDFEDIENNGVPYYKYDHYAVNIACDFNHDTGSEIQIVLNKGRNTHFRRCLYGMSIHDIQLEYVKQFWDKYNDTRKVFRTVFNENHEATGELIKYNDNGYVNLLNYFNEKGYLKDTVVMVVSDHGQHFIVGRSFFLPDDSRLEENYLPFLLLLIPRDIPQENMRFLENNQQLFVTAHEIYGTLKSLAMGELSRSDAFKGYSPMHEDLPKGRDCDQNKGEIEIVQCWCSLDKDYADKKMSKRSYFYVEF